jgi:Spy/CpxP family protein refolding chaperone
MTRSVKTMLLGAGALLLAIGTGAGAFVHAQDQNTNQPARPFAGGSGRPGGPGRFGPGGFGGPMGMLRMFSRALNLTDAQRDQIRATADSHRDEWKALADRERGARTALIAAVTADTIDEAAIRQKSSEVAAVEADAAVARAHAHAEVARILTADQRAQLKAMVTGPRRHPQAPARH